MNRIVEGTGTRLNPVDQSEGDQKAKNPHRAERSYSRLAQLWKISSDD
jgi:hypothetical protein